jgi:hypothetical protein
MMRRRGWSDWGRTWVGLRGSDDTAERVAWQLLKKAGATVYTRPRAACGVAIYCLDNGVEKGTGLKKTVHASGSKSWKGT